jgi:hypothetical protein
MEFDIGFSPDRDFFVCAGNSKGYFIKKTGTFLN